MPWPTRRGAGFPRRASAAPGREPPRRETRGGRSPLVLLAGEPRLLLLRAVEPHGTPFARGSVAPTVLVVLQHERRHLRRAALLVLRDEGDVRAAHMMALARDRVLALDAHARFHRG